MGDWVLHPDDDWTPLVRHEDLLDVMAELQGATDRFGSFASPHEGYAVLLEEMDEMWQEIKHGTPERVRAEALQVAAMALRFLNDCCEKND